MRGMRPRDRSGPALRSAGGAVLPRGSEGGRAGGPSALRTSGRGRRREWPEQDTNRQEVIVVPDKRPSVKNEDQYEALKRKGMSKSRAARIANSPGASKRGGEKSGSGTRRRASSQGGTTAQKKA